MDDSWTDSNLNRVSVIQFQEETKAEEEEDDEAAAERRVSNCWRFCFKNKGTDPTNDLMTASQGLQRRATPHPSELKVMKKVIEERRNEAFASRPDGEESNDAQVNGARGNVNVSSVAVIQQEAHFFHSWRLFRIYRRVFPSFCDQEKRLSDLSNQSHDSQVSNSTLSANSAEDRRLAPSQREDQVDGSSVQEEELDEMDVEYIEVKDGFKIFCSALYLRPNGSKDKNYF